MRARREDIYLKLSNPRVDPKRNALLIDWEVVTRGKMDGSALVLRTDDGGRAEVALKSLEGRESGTIQLVGSKQFGNIKIRTKAMFPEDVEMYVIRSDDRYDPPLKCMVSNSVVMGKTKTTSRATRLDSRGNHAVYQAAARLQESERLPHDRRGRAGPSYRNGAPAVSLRRPGWLVARSGLRCGRLGQAKDRLAAGPSLRR